MRLIDSTQLILNAKSDKFVTMKEIIDAPEIDPVVHGRWENGCNVCPICGMDKFSGLEADIYADWQPKHCPNCGAKMDIKD